MKKFRPIDFPAKVAIKQRRLQGQLPQYNWVENNEYYPVSWQINHKTLSRQFYKLHYLACHAPRPVRLRWWPIYKQKSRKMFGTLQMSRRYANAWSCHSWL